MWNILNEVTKREQSPLKSFNNDCFASKFMLDHMEVKYYNSPYIREGEKIKFNHNGDLFGCFSGEALHIWHTYQRKEITKIRHNYPESFQFLNQFNYQNDIGTAIAYENKIEFQQITPDGDLCAIKVVPLDDKKNDNIVQLALCPKSETELFCMVTNGLFYRIDLRADPVIVGRHQFWSDLKIIEHDPIRNELCIAGDFEDDPISYVRIFETRKLGTPLKEYKVKDTALLVACSYNFDGSKILASNINGQTHLIFNDNTKRNIHQYNKRFRDDVQFFGPKSEFITYLEKEDEIGHLVFKNTNKLDIKSFEHHEHAVKTIFIDTASSLTPHPNKPIIVSHLMSYSPRLAIFSPKDSFNDHTCDEHGNCCHESGETPEHSSSSEESTEESSEEYFSEESNESDEVFECWPIY